MLLALTRPARLVDFSKLDIQARFYTSAGVIFKAQHLSKQSRSTKPLVDFFNQDIQKMTLQAYMRPKTWNSGPCQLTMKKPYFSCHELGNMTQ